jgi:hypothetical protein
MSMKTLVIKLTTTESRFNASTTLVLASDYIHGHRTSHLLNDRIYFRVAIHSTFWKICRKLKFEICEIPPYSSLFAQTTRPIESHHKASIRYLSCQKGQVQVSRFLDQPIHIDWKIAKGTVWCPRSRKPPKERRDMQQLPMSGTRERIIQTTRLCLKRHPGLLS